MASTYIHSLQFNNEMLAVAGDDFILFPCVQTSSKGPRTPVVTIYHGDKRYELIGHTESIHDIEFDERILVSCSSDTTLRIW